MRVILHRRPVQLRLTGGWYVSGSSWARGQRTYIRHISRLPCVSVWSIAFGVSGLGVETPEWQRYIQLLYNSVHLSDDKR